MPCSSARIAKKAIAKTETLNGGQWVETGDYAFAGIGTYIDCKDYPSKASFGAYAKDAKRVSAVCKTGPVTFVETSSYQRNRQTYRDVIFNCHLKKTQVWKEVVNKEF